MSGRTFHIPCSAQNSDKNSIGIPTYYRHHPCLPFHRYPYSRFKKNRNRNKQLSTSSYRSNEQLVARFIQSPYNALSATKGVQLQLYHQHNTLNFKKNQNASSSPNAVSKIPLFIYVNLGDLFGNSTTDLELKDAGLWWGGATVVLPKRSC